MKIFFFLDSKRIQMSDTTTAANQESVDAPPYQFSSLQQWQIAYIYAFSATFNHHQEVSPQYYKLPLFTPQVSVDRSKVNNMIHHVKIGFGR